jgi:Holliday junction resolvase RusA-like endonuclease
MGQGAHEMTVISIDSIKMVSLNAKYGAGVFGGKARLYLTKEYKAFKDEIFYSCKPVKVKPPYEVTIDIWTPTDADNILKPLGDSLQKRGVITNDSEILRWVINKTKVKKGTMGKLVVKVKTMEGS